MKVGLGQLALLLEKVAAGHKWVLLLVLAVFILPMPALAQDAVTLSGAVKDNQGSPLSGAEVQVIDPGSQPVLLQSFTLAVTKLADTNDGVCSSDCSLREAIAAAASGDTVTFAPGLTGAITLSLGQITISKNLTIQGPGASLLSIGGGNSANGGAISNTGSLTIRDITFSGNSASNASNGGNGGAITTQGSLTVTNSTFSGNSAGGAGGAISNSGGSLIVTNSTFSGNSAHVGGAIHNAGNLTVTNSTFSGGNSATYGGAIANSGNLTVTNSTFSGNLAGRGGAIYNGSSLTVTNSTFSGNSAHIGGAIYTSGSLTVISSTLSGNSAVVGGGALLISNAVQINEFGTLSVGNSIIAGNTAINGPDVIVSGHISSRGHNLLGNNEGASGLTNGVNGDLVGVYPLLGPLANNGGPTATHALLPGSPAIDAGDNTMCAAAVGSPTYGAGGLDQRGVTRPQGARCDIGAYEFVPPPADLSLTKTDSLDPVTVGQNLTYTLRVTNNGPSTATGVTLTDTLPTGATYVFTTPSQGSCSGTSTVTCIIGSLANGASATVTILVTAPSTAGTITNTARVGSFETDPVLGNNTAAATTTVNPATVTLSLTKAGTGSGTVTSSPAGINCGADCSEAYASGTYVTPTATPAAGSIFAGWSGACSGAGECTLTITASTSITATFNLQPLFKVKNLPPGLQASKGGQPDFDLSVTGENGDTETTVTRLIGGKRVPVVGLLLRFSQGADIDLGNDLEVDADEIEGKAVFHRANPFPSGVQLRELRVKKLPQHDQVRVCPGATNLAQVNRTCDGGYVLKQGHPDLTIFTDLNGEVFWFIRGITGTGAQGQTNTAPTASGLAISPASPTSADILVARYSYFDADGDPQSGTEIRWFKDGTLQQALNDQNTAPASATTAGEQWHFTVRPKDGVDFGGVQTSASVTVDRGGGAPPGSSSTSGGGSGGGSSLPDPRTWVMVLSGLALLGLYAGFSGWMRRERTR